MTYVRAICLDLVDDRAEKRTDDKHHATHLKDHLENQWLTS